MLLIFRTILKRIRTPPSHNNAKPLYKLSSNILREDSLRSIAGRSSGAVASRYFRYLRTVCPTRTDAPPIEKIHTRNAVSFDVKPNKRSPELQQLKKVPQALKHRSVFPYNKLRAVRLPPLFHVGGIHAKQRDEDKNNHPCPYDIFYIHEGFLSFAEILFNFYAVF